MKKKLCAALLLIMVGINYGMICQDSAENWEVSEAKFTFVAPIANDGYWGQMALAISEACEEQGIDVKCVGNSRSNSMQQIENIRSAVRSGVDGIITTGLLDSGAFRNVLMEAHEAEIPVVLIDSNAEDTIHLCYIGIDNFSAGQTAASLLADLTGGKGKVAVAASETEKSNQSERLRGFRKELEKYPQMELVAVLDKSESIIALKDQIKQLLDQNPQIDALFCLEGYSSRAISLIMEEYPENYKEICKVVFDLNDDTSQALKNGYVDVVLEQKPRIMGTEAVRVLNEWRENSVEKKEDIFLEPEIITGENDDIEQTYISGELTWYVY